MSPFTLWAVENWLNHQKQVGLVCSNVIDSGFIQSLSKLCLPRLNAFYGLCIRWVRGINPKGSEKKTMQLFSLVISTIFLSLGEHFLGHRRSQIGYSPALFVRATGNPAHVGGGGHPLHDGVLIAALCVQRELLRDLVHAHQLTCGGEGRAPIKLGKTLFSQA